MHHIRVALNKFTFFLRACTALRSMRQGNQALPMIFTIKIYGCIESVLLQTVEYNQARSSTTHVGMMVESPFLLWCSFGSISSKIFLLETVTDSAI